MRFEQQATALSRKEIAALLVEREALRQELQSLKHQLDWFKRQLFGEKSERRVVDGNARQLALGEVAEHIENACEPTQSVKAYQRRKSNKKPSEGAREDTGLRFDESVPVEVIEVPNPELKNLREGDYEVVSEKSTYRLAQKPTAYVVLKYVRKLIVGPSSVPDMSASFRACW